MKKSGELKAEGNKYFLQGHYSQAKQLYTQAIKLDPTVTALYSNRAMCELKMEQHGLAIADASKAIELDPSFAKAYYRRASAHLSILDPKAALPDLKMVLKIEPRNAQVKAQLDATVKLVRRLEFERAIRVEEGTPPSKTVEEYLEQSISGAAVPADYTGPRLPVEASDGQVISPAVEDKSYLGRIDDAFIDRMLEQLKGHFTTEFGLAFALKPIHLVHIAGFVVTTVHQCRLGV